MVSTCCVVGCSNRHERGKNIRFFRIPRDRHHRQAFVNAINRKDWIPNEFCRVCSDHFVSGYVAWDRYDVDYAPSLNMNSKKKYSQRKIRTSKQNVTKVTSGPSATNPTTSSTCSNILEPQKAMLVLQENPASSTSDTLHGFLVFSGTGNLSANLQTPDETPEAILPTSECLSPEPIVVIKKEIEETSEEFDDLPQTIENEYFLHEPHVVLEENFETSMDFNLPQTREIGIQVELITLKTDGVVVQSESESGRWDTVPTSETEHCDIQLLESFSLASSNQLLHNTLHKYTKPIAKSDRVFVVFETMLVQLFTFCRLCFAACSATVTSTYISMVVIQTQCKNGHIVKWQSQPGGERSDLGLLKILENEVKRLRLHFLRKKSAKKKTMKLTPSVPSQAIATFSVPFSKLPVQNHDLVTS